MWKAVDDLLARGIAEGIFPGCAMAAGQGTRVLFTSVHGALAQGDARGVTHTTRYDVGLLTEVMATVPLLLYALEHGLVSLDDRLGRWLGDVPQDKREITLLHLLTHSSGMSASFLLSQEAEGDRDALGALLRHPLSGSVGAKVRDSAMGFILLGFLLERVFGMPLDEAVKRFVTAPLRMPSTGYLPAGDDVAPAGGESEGAEWQAGQPQDGNARFLHGVAGHAGLFTDLEDIIRYASMLAGDGRNEEGVVFSYRSIHLATTERTRGLNEARGYGFRITKRSDPFLGRPERKGKIQLIDASSFSKKLRKALGDKKNEISPEDRTAITKLYADFAENEYCKIYPNQEFIYREYVVMQPLQRSYAITAERIEAMLSKGSLSSLYDQAKVDELENAEELTGKELKKLEAYQNNQPVYEAIVAALSDAISAQVYLSPVAFMPVLTKVLTNVTADKKLLEKIADGLSVMDKSAEIQRDRKGNVLYDKETKDTEIVKWDESIEDYMAREVLPHIPDAVAFFEENLDAKKPVVKTGAEIPFTRYFYKYQQPVPSEELEAKFMELELSVSERVAKLFE